MARSPVAEPGFRLGSSIRVNRSVLDSMVRFFADLHSQPALKKHTIRCEFRDQLAFEVLTMIKIEDILSLTEFHRHSREHIARLRVTGRPEVLTVNGRAELVVQNAAAYQHLLERIGRNEATMKNGSKQKASGKAPISVRRKRSGQAE